MFKNVINVQTTYLNHWNTFKTNKANLRWPLPLWPCNSGLRVYYIFSSQATLLYLKIWTGNTRLTFSLASCWCLWLSYLLVVKQIPPPWAHLFIRDPLRLVQGEGAVEGAVLRHHAKTAGAPDEFLSVGNCRHSASAAVSLLWTGRILSTTNCWACTPFAMIDRVFDESEHSVHITCVGVCFDSCSSHEGGNIKFCLTRHFFFYFCHSVKDRRSFLELLNYWSEFPACLLSIRAK